MKDDDETLPRAGLLGKLAAAPLALGALAALGGPAASAPTMSQKAAGYVPVSKSKTMRCARCLLFLPNKSDPAKPGRCTLVIGTIAPNGYCDQYSPR